MATLSRQVTSFEVLLGSASPKLNSVPGDTESGMDWTFYVPKVRNYIVLYGDAYAEDDILPIENPARNPWHPGIYITRIPGIPKLDLHVEGVSTEQGGIALTTLNLGQFNYWNFSYPRWEHKWRQSDWQHCGSRRSHHPVLAYLLDLAAKHLAISSTDTTPSAPISFRAEALGRTMPLRTRCTFEAALL